MAQTPVIHGNGGGGVGPTPRLWGTAEPNHSVRIVQANTGVVFGQGVAGPDGQWAIDVNLNTDQWVQLQAQSYVVQGDPSTESGYSNSVNLQR
jgi:hypothetical protein